MKLKQFNSLLKYVFPPMEVRPGFAWPGLHRVDGVRGLQANWTELNTWPNLRIYPFSPGLYSQLRIFIKMSKMWRNNGNTCKLVHIWVWVNWNTVEQILKLCGSYSKKFWSPWAHIHVHNHVLAWTMCHVMRKIGPNAFARSLIWPYIYCSRYVNSTIVVLLQ